MKGSHFKTCLQQSFAGSHLMVHHIAMPADRGMLLPEHHQVSFLLPLALFVYLLAFRSPSAPSSALNLNSTAHLTVLTRNIPTLLRSKESWKYLFCLSLVSTKIIYVCLILTCEIKELDVCGINVFYSKMEHKQCIDLLQGSL